MLQPETPPGKSCGDPGLGCPQNQLPPLSLGCGQGWQVGFTSRVRVTPACWGRFSREWALAFSFRAEEAGVWHRPEVPSTAGSPVYLAWFVHETPGTPGEKSRVQACWGAAWHRLRALWMVLRTHSGTNKSFLGPSPQAPAWNRHLFVSQDVLRALELWGKGPGASHGIRYPCSVPRS